jgi:hypothetical protein
MVADQAWPTETGLKGRTDLRGIQPNSGDRDYSRLSALLGKCGWGNNMKCRHPGRCPCRSRKFDPVGFAL